MVLSFFRVGVGSLASLRTVASSAGNVVVSPDLDMLEAEAIEEERLEYLEYLEEAEDPHKQALLV